MKDIYSGKKILVTGASSGIGLEFARILNKYDCTLILAARSRETLEKTKQSLSMNGLAKISCFNVNLSRLEELETFYHSLEEKNLIPDILINNAGKQNYGYFHKLKWQDEYNQIILNCLAPIFLIHKIVPNMLKNNYGKILNVGSVAGTMPGPFFATYAATKAFINSFSQSLSGEINNQNIQCTCLLPGVTNTNNFWDLPVLKEKIGDVSRFTSAYNVATYGLRLLEQNKEYGVCGLSNKTTQFIKRFTPLKLLNFALKKHNYSNLLEPK
ncbi:MAG: SDR family NAD(P)-dependent oxidoreductase [Candidatus Omnitrophica bacterium]|nr:SDR family NAD(P)-dependent oxidoreductase [Candidatus Omnitrophota bacterium]